MAMFVSVAGVANAQPGDDLPGGAGMFAMAEATGVSGDALRVFYYRPSGWTPDGGKIVIALHGVERDAARYLGDWRPYAEKYRLLVICPEFSEKKYPGSRYYNTGNVTDGKEAAGNLQPREAWVFQAVERVFAAVRLRTGAKADTYTLFGHSAGAQFAHRYGFFATGSKAETIIAANAGWYTLPVREAPFPYGIANLPLTDADLAKAFARRIVVLLGERDEDATSKHLRHNSWVDKQGPNRFERGQAFFAKAREKATELGVPFNWQLITVPGVGHFDAGMAAAAARIVADK